MLRTPLGTAPGSSPRMRGALWYQRHNAPLVGIIPADAGSTKEDDLLYNGLEDHPRGCGEHHTASLMIVSIAGSSPRMRGARLERLDDISVAGIIPADAGSTNAISA